ncbi:hypothetical protein C2E25_02560 [Geothermobacter hydrogeniphilus]|uniref:Na+-driven multidrug efflux pump n=1 Tax=Geothermobacter hydrogeniphilus TaxID=1969733 RepID=A0A2K2HDU3_9BACT|nr:hypothetical protein [Geothermobacter hydrogeniphilus]PNU21454.1 hypothetical protein C2E25_02560 [Geothermobacter hydrogeniphilus]
MTASAERLTYSRIFRFWSPLATTWLLMAAEGPLLAALIARMEAPVPNLAAFGVAYAFALVAEAPVIMLMSAATALCRDAESYRRLRSFTLLLSGGVTLLLGTLVIPTVFDRICVQWIGLPPEIAEPTWQALLWLLPWPGAIGLRRFYQGVLIADGRTRRVTVGTLARVSSMAVSGFTLAAVGVLPGAAAGGLALAVGVVAEMLVARRLTRPSIKRLLRLSGEGEPLDFRGITRFYLPLAMTPLIALSVQPVVTFFLGRGRFPIESLAVLPVLYGLTFIFRALGLSYQEAAIALVGRKLEHRREGGRFALVLGFFCVATLALIALTPLADLWLRGISGLEPTLADFARLPLMLMCLLPGMTVWITWQRSLLVLAKRTTPVSTATAVEALAILALLALFIPWLDWPGISIAALALTAGRMLGICYLMPHCRRLAEVPISR